MKKIIKKIYRLLDLYCSEEHTVSEKRLQEGASMGEHKCSDDQEVEADEHEGRVLMVWCWWPNMLSYGEGLIPGKYT